jgi:MYXO-CTERM domain-containing protein
VASPRTLLAAASLCLLAVTAARSARAYCRTSTTSTSDFDGHVCTPPQNDDSGSPVYWDMPRITYSLQEDASQQVSFEAARSALRAAFDEWMAADCDGEPPRLEVIEAEVAACAQQEYNRGRGNANLIFFVDEGWEGMFNQLAITVVTFGKESGRIYDADVMINSTDHTFTVGGTGYDLQSVFTHEAGHFLGIAHSPVPEAMMFATYSSPGGTGLGALAEDDRAAICAIFPPGDIADGCDATPWQGFSPLCGADQPAPVSDEPLAGDRCCCTGGAECVEGVCVGGCDCTVSPPRSTPWPPAAALVALGAALARRRRRQP